MNTNYKKHNTMDIEFENWLKDRPQSIRDLATKYPPTQKYIIKEGAPYGISCPGTVVEIYSYEEDGTISVIVTPKEKRKEAIDHEEYLGEKHGRSKEDIAKFKDAAILVNIEPKWMSPLFNDN